jgi:uncharacterized phage protein gp47/JayE
MYESQTFETILQRMLDRIPATIDKREGSIIYDALAPAAAELAQAYIELDVILTETFADTSNGEFLARRAAERGVNRKPATKAVRLGLFTDSSEAAFDPPIGSRFSGDDLNYVVVEKITDGQFKLECETAGEVGNSYVGTLLPIGYIPELATATLTDILVPGANEESDESLRERYFEEIINQAIDGNIAQYRKWANEYAGIGRAKVFPLWDGPNTVKVSILDAENQVASAGLISDFQEYLDPGAEGLGNGVAPIGAKVTVTTATGVNINVSAEIVLAEGYSEVNGVDEALTAYLKEIAYAKNTVSYISIGAAILDVPAVDQVRNLQVNGTTTDIVLTAEQIPILGTTNWTVVSP